MRDDDALAVGREGGDEGPDQTGWVVGAEPQARDFSFCRVAQRELHIDDRNRVARLIGGQIFSRRKRHQFAVGSGRNAKAAVARGNSRQLGTGVTGVTGQRFLQADDRDVVGAAIGGEEQAAAQRAEGNAVGAGIAADFRVR